MRRLKRRPLNQMVQGPLLDPELFQKASLTFENIAISPESHLSILPHGRQSRDRSLLQRCHAPKAYQFFQP